MSLPSASAQCVLSAPMELTAEDGTPTPAPQQPDPGQPYSLSCTAESRGIRNPGNACWFIVAVQTLVFLPFHRHFLPPLLRPAFKKLYDAAQTGASRETQSAALTLLLRAMGAAQPLYASFCFDQFTQMDANECLLAILAIDQEPGAARTCFTAGIYETRTCGQCKKTGENVLQMESLGLAFPVALAAQPLQLTELLAAYFRDEQFVQRCDAACMGALVAHTMSTSISNAPDILTVSLKRFACLAGKTSKICAPVAIPEQLNLASFASPCLRDDRDKPTYTLTAVIVHVGGQRSSGMSGHYIAHIRGAGGAYFRFDDAKPAKQQNYEEMSSSWSLNSTPYILIYTNDSKSVKERPPYVPSPVAAAEVTRDLKGQQSQRSAEIAAAQLAASDRSLHPNARMPQPYAYPPLRDDCKLRLLFVCYGQDKSNRFTIRANDLDDVLQWTKERQALFGVQEEEGVHSINESMVLPYQFLLYFQDHVQCSFIRGAQFEALLEEEDEAKLEGGALALEGETFHMCNFDFTLNPSVLQHADTRTPREWYSLQRRYVKRGGRIFPLIEVEDKMEHKCTYMKQLQKVLPNCIAPSVFLKHENLSEKTL